MNHNPRMKWLSLAACLFLGLVLGYTISGLEERDDAAKLIGFAVVGAIIVIVPLSIVWWRSLDELAQEAHKSAFFWGGSTAMGVVMLPLLIMMELAQRDSFGLASVPGNEGYVYGLYAGVAISIGAVMGGYFLAWILFWWRKR